MEIQQFPWLPLPFKQLQTVGQCLDLGMMNMATSSSTVGVTSWFQPSISTVAYDYQTGEITFSGNYFASQIGTNNDLVANSFTAVGEDTVLSKLMVLLWHSFLSEVTTTPTATA